MTLLNVRVMLPKILALMMVFSPLSGHCDNKMPISVQSMKELQNLGFDTNFLVNTPTQASISSEIRNTAEKRLREVLAPNLLALFDKNPTLVACPSNHGHYDGFAANIANEEGTISIFISEFYITFAVFPENLSHLDKETAISAFHLWRTRLLKPFWEAEGTKKDIEVLDKGAFFLVKKKLYDENRKSRLMAWTKAESINLALDKAESWLLLKFRDVSPDKCTSWPGGFRLRLRGSWFTSPTKK